MANAKRDTMEKERQRLGLLPDATDDEIIKESRKRTVGTPEQTNNRSHSNAFTRFLIGDVAGSFSNLFGAAHDADGYIDSEGKYVIKNCFVKGTLVDFANGKKPIEEIKTGDYVFAINEKTGVKSLKKVLQTYIRQTNQIYKLTYETGNIIETTWNHPFYIEGKGWTEAKDIRVGDSSVLKTGDSIEIISIIIEEKDVTVYNFTVEEEHNYFVGVDGVLVHNISYTENPELPKMIKKLKNQLTLENRSFEKMYDITEEALIYPYINMIASDLSLGPHWEALKGSIAIKRLYSIDAGIGTKIKLMYNDLIKDELDLVNKEFVNKEQPLKDKIKELQGKVNITEVAAANTMIKTYDETLLDLNIKVKAAKSLTEKDTLLKQIEHTKSERLKFSSLLSDYTKLKDFREELSSIKDKYLKKIEKLEGITKLKLTEVGIALMEYGFENSTRSEQFDMEVTSIQQFEVASVFLLLTKLASSGMSIGSNPALYSYKSILTKKEAYSLSTMQDALAKAGRSNWKAVNNSTGTSYMVYDSIVQYENARNERLKERRRILGEKE